MKGLHGTHGPGVELLGLRRLLGSFVGLRHGLWHLRRLVKGIFFLFHERPDSFPRFFVSVRLSSCQVIVHVCALHGKVNSMQRDFPPGIGV